MSLQLNSDFCRLSHKSREYLANLFLQINAYIVEEVKPGKADYIAKTDQVQPLVCLGIANDRLTPAFCG